MGPLIRKADSKNQNQILEKRRPKALLKEKSILALNSLSRIEAKHLVRQTDKGSTQGIFCSKDIKTRHSRSTSHMPKRDIYKVYHSKIILFPCILAELYLVQKFNFYI